MTQSDTPEIRPGLSRLSWKSWLTLVLALSAVGSQLTVWSLSGINYLYVGGSGDTVLIVHNIFGSPMLLELSYVFLLSLTVNLCGAFALMAFFTIRRRLKRS